ncbi:MAG TPA: hypothetical protein DEZ08_05865, partial [Dehalococcoidia bacterium]|nr:hypothetical protein [Dehalococcoidia bacterium]
MSGHMGNRQITVKNLEILLIDAERNLIAVKGGIPGARNSMVTIKRTGLHGDTKTLLGQELEDAMEAVVEDAI